MASEFNARVPLLPPHSIDILKASKKMKQRLWWREHKLYLAIGLLVIGGLVVLGKLSSIPFVSEHSFKTQSMLDFVERDSLNISI